MGVTLALAFFPLVQRAEFDSFSRLTRRPKVGRYFIAMVVPMDVLTPLGQNGFAAHYGTYELADLGGIIESCVVRLVIDCAVDSKDVTA